MHMGSSSAEFKYRQNLANNLLENTFDTIIWRILLKRMLSVFKYDEYILVEYFSQSNSENVTVRDIFCYYLTKYFPPEYWHKIVPISATHRQVNPFLHTDRVYFFVN